MHNSLQTQGPRQPFHDMDQPSLIVFDARQRCADGLKNELIYSGINIHIFIAETTEQLAFRLQLRGLYVVLVCSVDSASAWADIIDLASRHESDLLAWAPAFESPELDALLRTHAPLVRSVTQARQLQIALNCLQASHRRPAGRHMASRLAFFDTVQEFLSQASDSSSRAALVYLRPDGFDSVHRLFGHAASESYLSDLEAIVERCLRNADLFCRFSDHGFLLFMCTDAARDPFEDVERLRQTCSEHSIQFYEGAMAIRCSAGMASVTPNAGSLDDLIERASQACKMAQKQGNSLVRYRPSLEIAAPEPMPGDWAERLERAIEGRGFYTLHQAVVDLEGDGEMFVDSQVILREAAGDTGPDDWRPAAVACHLGSRIDHATLPGQLMALSAGGSHASGIISISAESVLDPGFPAWLEAQLVESGLPGTRLIVQMHCADALTHARPVRAMTRQLIPLGCRLALSGYDDDPHFEYLLEPLQVHLVRLPARWIFEIRQRPERLERWKLLVRHLRDAKIEVLADGVSNATELSLAWQAGIRRLSGEFLIEYDHSGRRQVS